MDDSPRSGESPAERRSSPDPARLERVAQLADAIVALGGDTDYIIDALTQKLRALRPLSTKSSLSRTERRFLIETGVFTESEYEGIMTAIGRGVLQLDEVQSWMFRLLDTLSAEEAANQLELTDQELQQAVRGREVLVVTVSGRLRFPRWQFVAGPEGRLLPGLSALIPAISACGSFSSAAFMHSPMEDLSGHGPRTPIQWLREGGDVGPVLELLSDDGIA